MLLHRDSPYLYRVYANYGTRALELIVMVFVHLVIAYDGLGRWKHKWDDALETLWIPMHYYILCSEYATAAYSYAVRDGPAVLRISVQELDQLQAVGIANLGIDCIMVSLSVRDWVENDWNGEYMDRFIFTVVVFITSVVRVLTYATATQTDIKRINCRQSGSTVFVEGNGVVHVQPISNDAITIDQNGSTEGHMPSIHYRGKHNTLT